MLWPFTSICLYASLDENGYIYISVSNSLGRRLIIIQILAGSNQQMMKQYMLHPQMEPSVAQTWRLEFHHL